MLHFLKTAWTVLMAQEFLSSSGFWYACKTRHLMGFPCVVQQQQQNPRRGLDALLPKCHWLQFWGTRCGRPDSAVGANRVTEAFSDRVRVICPARRGNRNTEYGGPWPTRTRYIARGARHAQYVVVVGGGVSKSDLLTWRTRGRILAMWWFDFPRKMTTHLGGYGNLATEDGLGSWGRRDWKTEESTRSNQQSLVILVFSLMGTIYNASAPMDGWGSWKFETWRRNWKVKGKHSKQYSFILLSHWRLQFATFLEVGNFEDGEDLEKIEESTRKVLGQSAVHLHVDGYNVCATLDGLGSWVFLTCGRSDCKIEEHAKRKSGSL